MAKSQKQIDKLLDEIDFSSLTPEQITGKDGLLNQFTKRMLEKR